MFSVLLSTNHTVARNSLSASNVIVADDNYTPVGSIINLTSSPNYELRTTNYELNNNTLTFTTEPEAENLTEVYIDGDRYTLGSLSLEPGEFSFNPDTKDVVVYVRGNVRTGAIVAYEVRSQESGVRSNSSNLAPSAYSLVPTNQICHAGIIPLFSRWNVKENVTINHAFNDHSSLSFSFVTCKSEQNIVRTQLATRTEFTAFNQRWAIASLSITLLGRSSDRMVVTVSCKDWLAPRGNPSLSLLDKPLKLKRGKVNRRTITEFTNEAGVNYRGVNFSIRVPRSTSSNDTTTVRQLLNKYAIAQHCFIFYAKDGVELRRWGETPTHVISTSEVKGDISLDLRGHGSELDGVQLHTEWRNQKLNLDFDSDATNRKSGVTVRWVFENCRDLEDLYSPKEDFGFYFKQPDPETLRSPSLNFDSGGRVKRATKITELNGTPTFEETWEAGYAFSTADTYEVELTSQGNYYLRLRTNINPETHWKEIKHTITDHIYDKDGYLIKTITTGTQLARLRQESEKLEAIILTAQALQNSQDIAGISTPDPSLTAQAEAYQFSETLPINDVTDYSLEKHRDYYPDTIKPGDECDDDFIEPKFVKFKNRLQESYIIGDHPETTEEFILPPIVTGKFFSDRDRTTITSTAFPFKFEQRQSASNIEGEFGKNAIRLGTTTQNLGKPGIHQRLDHEVYQVNPQGARNYERYGSKNYYLHSIITNYELSEEASGGFLRNGKSHLLITNYTEGTKSYPDVDNPDEAVAIAETELSIINTQNSLTATISLHYRDDVRVGDRLIFQGKYWIVLGVSDSRTVIKNGFTSSSFELSIGRLLQPRLRLEDRRC